MADKLADHIKKKSEAIAKKLGRVQDEVIDAYLELTKGMSTDEAIEAINSINTNKLMTLKASGAISDFVSANTEMLKLQEFFTPIKEETLRALLNSQTNYINGYVKDYMGSNIKNEVISGIVNNKSVKEIKDSIYAAGFDPDKSLDKIVRNSMNQYSKGVTARQALDAPKNTKYIYAGAIDDRTREVCLQYASLGEVTLEELNALGLSLDTNGGWECRHKWRISVDPEAQGWKGDQANKFMKASDE